jgi:Ca-activated chloride channel family protein
MKTLKYLTLVALSFLVFSGCFKRDDGIYPSEAGYYEDTYNENYKEYDENPFVKVSDQPVSTFSVDADGASYANMRRFLYYGQTPPKASYTNRRIY